MNFVAICLHCLDMRDFNSSLRNTPFLNELRKKSVFIPMGRAQGHNDKDSVLSELTGVWSSRYSNSEVSKNGFKKADGYQVPKMLWEYLKENDYQVSTSMGSGMSISCLGGLERVFGNNRERLDPFLSKWVSMDKYLENIRKKGEPFYAHFVIRSTHRPWDQKEELCNLMGVNPEDKKWKEIGVNPIIWAARWAALRKKEEFIALRMKGLKNADNIVKRIFDEFSKIENTTFIVYSNHGELFDHFQGVVRFPEYSEDAFNHPGPYGTTHGPTLPYEKLYANMQMWIIPGIRPKMMAGMGRLIDFAPTILDLGGITQNNMDGESMKSYFNQGFFPKRVRYAEGGGCASIVNKNGLKVIFGSGLPDHSDKVCVFDLLRDPWEYQDIANSPQGSEAIESAIKKHADLKYYNLKQ